MFLVLTNFVKFQILIKKCAYVPIFNIFFYYIEYSSFLTIRHYFYGQK